MSYKVQVRPDQDGLGSNKIEVKLPEKEYMILTERDVPEGYEEIEETTCLYYAVERIAELEEYLQASLNGLKWYQDTFPSAYSPMDDEHNERCQSVIDGASNGRFDTLSRQARREALCDAAKVAHDACKKAEEIALKHSENSDSRGRMMARAREASYIERDILHLRSLS